MSPSSLFLCRTPLVQSTLGVPDHGRQSGNYGQLCFHEISRRVEVCPLDRKEEVYSMATCQLPSLESTSHWGVLFVFHMFQLIHPYSDGKYLVKIVGVLGANNSEFKTHFCKKENTILASLSHLEFK